jgi:hypothetical protein
MKIVLKDDPAVEPALNPDDPLLAPDQLMQQLKTGESIYPLDALYIFIYLHQQNYPLIIDWIKHSGSTECNRIFNDCSLRLKSIRDSKGQIANLARIHDVETVRIKHLVEKGLIHGPDVSFITSPPLIEQNSTAAIIQSSFETVTFSDIMVSKNMLTTLGAR